MVELQTLVALCDLDMSLSIYVVAGDDSREQFYAVVKEALGFSLSGHSNFKQVRLANDCYFFNADVVLFGNLVGEVVWSFIQYVGVHAAGYNGRAASM